MKVEPVKLAGQCFAGTFAEVAQAFRHETYFKEVCSELAEFWQKLRRITIAQDMLSNVNMIQPPHYVDLVSCDFFLLSNRKKPMKAQRSRLNKEIKIPHKAHIKNLLSDLMIGKSVNTRVLYLIRYFERNKIFRVK